MSKLYLRRPFHASTLETFNATRSLSFNLCATTDLLYIKVCRTARHACFDHRKH